MQIFPPKITMGKTGTTGGAFSYVSLVGLNAKDILLGQAPIQGISISQGVDYSIAKTLAGNFSLLTFQDHPVIIKISGFQCPASTCDPKIQKNQAGELFKTYKASNNSATPLTVTIANTAYKAYLISVQLTGGQMQIPGILSYTLTFFGARVIKA